MKIISVNCRVPVAGLLLFLSLALPLTSLLAQQHLNWRYLGREDGTSNSVVHSILQDHLGFVWIGTGYGLDRFDGYKFVNFQQAADDPHSLSDNLVRCLYEDVLGNIWVGTAQGLNRLHKYESDLAGGKREGFLRFRANPEDSLAIINENIWSIAGDRNGGLWIGTAGGLIHFVPGVDGLAISQKYYHEKSAANTPLGRGIVRDILVEEDGSVVAASLGGGLNIINSAEGVSQRFVHNPADANSISSNFLVSLALDDKQRLWIGTYGGGLNLFDRQQQAFRHWKSDPEDPNTLGENRIFDIVPVSNGLWLATFGAGLNYFAHPSGKVTRYPHVETSREGPSNDFVRNLMLDKGRILWAGTNNGITKLDLKPLKFRHYSHDPHNKNSIADNRILAVLKDRQERVWVGHNAGLDRIVDGRVTRFDVDHRSRSGGSGFVTCLHEDRNSRIWFGSHGGGIYRVESQDGRFRQFLPQAGDPESLLHSFVRCFYEDQQGRLFIGTRNGVNQWLPEKQSFIEPIDNNKLISRSVNCLLGDDQGNLWIGTSEGLHQANLETEQMTHYSHDPDNPGSLSSNGIICLHLDRSGLLWIGTENGLNRLDPFSGETTRLYVRDGLPNNYISGLLGDEEGRLWISTISGFCRYDPNASEESRIRIYSRYDGLQGVEFLSGSYYRDPKSGEMFFGGINGFNSFYPQTVLDNPIVPQVALTGFYKYDRPFLLGRALQEETLVELGPDDRYFAIEFTALDFTVPERNQFAYRLDGFDKEWVISGNRRRAGYTNLDAGEYRFRVRAANHDGIWNMNGASLIVRILPPIYETWWFRILLFGAIIGFLALLYRYRVSKLLEIERVRVNIASDLHDDVGSSLTKISLYSDMVRDSGDRQMQTTLLGRIGALSRELILTMSDIVWSIDARNDNAGELLDRMRDFAGSVFSARNIDFKFEVVGLDDDRQLPIDVRQNLYLIFKEAINNIARHSEAKQVEIMLENSTRFIMRISDNGKGLPQSRGQRGNGIRNMEMRAGKLHGEFSIYSRDGVTIELRIKKI